MDKGVLGVEDFAGSVPEEEGSRDHDPGSDKRVVGKKKVLQTLSCCLSPSKDNKRMAGQEGVGVVEE